MYMINKEFFYLSWESYRECLYFCRREIEYHFVSSIFPYSLSIKSSLAFLPMEVWSLEKQCFKEYHDKSSSLRPMQAKIMDPVTLHS